MKFKTQISKSEWISFILTLIATLFGVFIAIWLTNSEVRNKEKKDAIKLLKTAKLILHSTSIHSKSPNNYMVKLEKDTINYTKNHIESIKSKNPIPYPDLLKTILSNNLVTMNVSEYTHNVIYSNLISSKKFAEYRSIEIYLKSLEEIIIILNLEIELLNDEIELTELKLKYNEQSKSKLKRNISPNTH
ncbi:hypothetical protein [uncultured Croceitalea sp.]|uniref:hypothetical protein n=1 Tax=uncultured Croceitalea sp. TaxID=1798908 RepID=UPI003305A98B